MEAKKVSFGFSKINKKPNLLPTKDSAKPETKLELIKCLEGQKIKLVEEKPVEVPLIIPLKEAQKTSTALASLMKRRAVLLGEEEPECTKNNLVEPVISKNNENFEDIEKRAAREILTDIQKNDSSDQVNNLVLPVLKPDDLPLDGAKESTIEDYESIPIQDFGKAMLRGMGWTEPLQKSNEKGGRPIEDTPLVRPKGMGLGADKALNRKNLLVAPETNEILEIKRNAYVVILGGKYKNLYGQIEGFDDHAGRVIVKMAIGGAKEAFNEFLCQPVSRKEFTQYGKCINNSKYDEYKKKENNYGQIIINKDKKEFFDKNDKKIKKEQKDSIEDKYPKNNDDYERNRTKEEYKEDKNGIKREKDDGLNKSKENDSRCAYDKYDMNNRNKEDNKGSKKEMTRDDYRYRKNETNSDDINDHRTQYDDRDKLEYHKDDSFHQLEHDRYGKKSDYSSSQTFKRNNIDYKRDSSLYETSYHTQKERQREGNKETNDPHVSKHKKSRNSNSKQKPKKSKKKYRCNSSDIELSSLSESSSSDSEEEKHKKHKKKTKKSKKQRERSRSRGRR